MGHLHSLFTRYRRIKAWSVLLLVFVGFVGCASDSPAIDNPLVIDRQEYARLYDAAIVVLRQRGFVVDRQDYRFGIITTKPIHSPTLAEPWQKINSTDEQKWASTINHQRRQITITLEPANRLETDHDTYLLRAEVIIQRLVVPVTHLTGSTAPRYLMAKYNQVPGEWKERGIQKAYWRTVTRDPQLEQQLLNDIVRQSFDLPSAPDAPPETPEALESPNAYGTFESSVPASNTPVE